MSLLSKNDKVWTAIYSSSLALAVASCGIGLVLEIGLTLDGPGLSWFGYQSYPWGLIPWLVFTLGWFVSRTRVKKAVRRRCLVAVVAILSITLFLTKPALVWSWRVACDVDHPTVCTMAASNWQDSSNVQIDLYQTACEGGSIEGCESLLEKFPGRATIDSIGDALSRHCQQAMRCERIGFSSRQCKQILKRLGPEDMARFCRMRDQIRKLQPMQGR